MRKIPLVENEYYHVFNRSIAGYNIFNYQHDYLRFLDVLKYYQIADRPICYAKFIQYSIPAKKDISENVDNGNKLVDIISYCLMPTHFHLLLKQNNKNGITKFLQQIENSYTRYFNVKHKRKGPLWESRFRSVHIESDEQLLHLTRYIHLNPTSAELVKKPEDWVYSSYHEYLGNKKGICEYSNVINLNPRQYRKFVNDRKNYQRQLSIIKSQLIDHHTD